MHYLSIAQIHWNFLQNENSKSLLQLCTLFPSFQPAVIGYENMRYYEIFPKSIHPFNYHECHTPKKGIPSVIHQKKKSEITCFEDVIISTFQPAIIGYPHMKYQSNFVS